MLDIGWSEMLMIAVVAIVVIGPKDLPRTLRTIGQWIGKARAMTRDLQNSVNDMISDSELDELRKASNNIGDFSPEGYLNQSIDSGALPTDGHSESDAQSGDYPTPPPTPMKWPPDEDDNAAMTEAAAQMPDITGDDEAAGSPPAKNPDA
jgi:sec-independent protein translocase protein TatB